MEQAVDAAEIDKRAIVGDVLDHAVDDLALFEARDDLAALLGSGLFKDGTARYDDVAAAAIHLQDLERLRHVHERANIADRPDIDLAARQEGHGAIEIHGETAFDAIEDHAFDAFAGLVLLLETGPAFLTARFFAREHGLAERILDALEIDVDLVADGKTGGATWEREFLEGNAAFGLEPDVDNRNVLLDGDDGTFDDIAFLKRGPRKGLVKKGCEFVVARVTQTGLRLDHLVSWYFRAKIRIASELNRNAPRRTPLSSEPR